MAAAFHGSSHQAAMVFQAVVPKQLRDFGVGRHRLQFLYQAPRAFARVNQPDLLGQIKSDAGYAKVAGVELTLLDCPERTVQQRCANRSKIFFAVPTKIGFCRTDPIGADMAMRVTPVAGSCESGLYAR
jgi:hypothetical protein